MKRGDPLAPSCASCHGTHDIRAAKDPALAGLAAQGPVHLRQVPPGRHGGDAAAQHPPGPHPGELLGVDPRRGPAQEGPRSSPRTAPPATPPTTSCPTPTPSPRSRAATSRRPAPSATPRSRTVHRKVIKGELWEKEAHVLPACVDCHQPHKVRKVFYTQGMADADCLKCHEAEGPQGAGRPLAVRGRSRSSSDSRHAKVACSQCHSGRQRLARAALRDDHARRWTAAPATPRSPSSTRAAGTASCCSTATRTPRRARSATGPTGSLGRLQALLADLPHERAAAVRALPPRGPEGGGALPGARSTRSSRPTPRASTARGC